MFTTHSSCLVSFFYRFFYQFLPFTITFTRGCQFFVTCTIQPSTRFLCANDDHLCALSLRLRAPRPSYGIVSLGPQAGSDGYMETLAATALQSSSCTGPSGAAASRRRPSSCRGGVLPPGTPPAAGPQGAPAAIQAGPTQAALCGHCQPFGPPQAPRPALEEEYGLRRR